MINNNNLKLIAFRSQHLATMNGQSISFLSRDTFAFALWFCVHCVIAQLQQRTEKTFFGSEAEKRKRYFPFIARQASKFFFLLFSRVAEQFPSILSSLLSTLLFRPIFLPPSLHPLFPCSSPIIPYCVEGGRPVGGELTKGDREERRRKE